METALHSDFTGAAMVALAALVCGIALEKMRQPAFVGYILAGVLLGPSALALVESRAQIDALADLGVLLLLFVIGMELPLRLFFRLWRLALLATLMQIAAAMLLTVLLARLFAWDLGMALVLGFVVALSSTAVAIKILEGSGEKRSRSGIISLGILIAQDLAFVPMIVILGIAAVGRTDFGGLAALIASMFVAAWLIWYLAKGGAIRLPLAQSLAGNAELGPLGGLAICFGAAALSGLLGLSPAYGAFLAGLALGNSAHKRELLGSTRPILSILMMVFFLSIGLLIDLAFIWDNLSKVLTLLFVVTVFKTAINTGILRALGQSWPQAFLVSVMLAQIGEFSFLLTRTGLETGLIGADVMRLVVAVTALSLAISPIWVVTARRLHDLTAVGIMSFGELMRSVYAQEADFLATRFNRIRPAAALILRRLEAARNWLGEANHLGRLRAGAGRLAGKITALLPWDIPWPRPAAESPAAESDEDDKPGEGEKGA